MSSSMKAFLEFESLVNTKGFQTPISATMVRDYV